MKVKNKCFKCGGVGTLPHYLHVHGGECFDCGGKGFVLSAPVEEYHCTPLSAKENHSIRIAGDTASVFDACGEFVRSLSGNVADILGWCRGNGYLIWRL